MNSELRLSGVTGLPLVQAGDDLVGLICDALARLDLHVETGDVLVVAQKIVSKAEGRAVKLADVTPSRRAARIAGTVEKDPRLVELVLRESKKIIRTAPGVLIVQHRLGIVCANAGIDQSNLEHDEGQRALLLPEDPDRSAARLRAGLMEATGKAMGVVINDSINRPWRLGTVGIAIGSAGVEVLDDRRGDGDLFGRQLQVTMSNRADSIATAALLIMGETTERIPVVLVRGLGPATSRQCARDAVRPPAEDLFLSDG